MSDKNMKSFCSNPKCIECDFVSFYQGNGNPSRYYCNHEKHGALAASRMICRTERHSTEITIKTSPRWCPRKNNHGS